MHVTDCKDTGKYVWFCFRVRLMKHSFISFSCCTRFVGIDSFKVGRFFSILPRKYAQIDINSVRKEIDLHIQQIEKFFTGSQSVEFYSNWLNYMYFLVITEKNKQLRSFVTMLKKQISELKAVSLDKNMYIKTKSINKRAKEYTLKFVRMLLCV